MPRMAGFMARGRSADHAEGIFLEPFETREEAAQHYFRNYRDNSCEIYVLQRDPRRLGVVAWVDAKLDVWRAERFFDSIKLKPSRGGKSVADKDKNQLGLFEGSAS